MTTLTRIARFLPPIVDLDYPPELLAARRAWLLECIREGQRDSDGLWREPEGSDTSMASQLDDAGFGSGGVL